MLTAIRRSSRPRPRTTRTGAVTVTEALVVAVFLMAGSVAAPADLDGQVPTRLLVRVTSNDAKIVGTSVGGARVTVRNVGTGEVLAEGTQEGSTGDTGRIMGTRERGSTVYATEGAAGFEAQLMLSEPTLVEITGEGPLGAAHAMQRSSKTMLLVPGRDVVGEGVVLELMGFTVAMLDPAEEGVTLPAGAPVTVRAKVTMLCGCPTEPGGLWDADGIEIVLRAVAAGEVLGEWPMAFSGQASEYTAEPRFEHVGPLTLQIIASDAEAGNFGMVERRVTVGG